MRSVFLHGIARARRDRGRTLLTAIGVAAAAAMVGAAATIVFALATAFDRTAAVSQMPDITARFADEPLAVVRSHVAALANVRAAAYRDETRADLRGGANYATATVDGVRGDGPRGYAITAGRDVARDGEAVVERGVARSWHLHVGQSIGLGGGSVRIVGVAVTPGGVAFPLSRSPHVYVAEATARRIAGAGGAVNQVLLWAKDPLQLDVTLAQARAASYGLRDLRFVTKEGYRHVIGRAAGLVVALLVAFSLIALAAAGVMLAASAGAEVQRRRQAIGVLRALGASPAAVAGGYALETVVVAAPAAAAGLVCGAAIVGGPTRRLLAILNELAPSRLATGVLLVACWLAIVVLVAAATWLPAWRAARASVVGSLRGADVVGTPRRLPLPALAGFGARLALARPARAATLVAVLAASSAVVLLILAIADVLRGLERNAQTLGTRYQLTVPASEISAGEVRRIRGVDGAAVRYESEAADSFDLGESFTLVGFAGDVSRYESPPLARGRRVAGDDEADVGLGLAQALDLHVGGVLAAQLPSGREVRFRVVGVVDALRNEGLVAYVRAPRLHAAMPFASAEIAVRLRASASLDRVRNILISRNAYPQKTGGIAQDTGLGSGGRTSFLRVLAALLRSVAVLDGLVCVYALAQMLALIARERRRAVALVRALGASRAQVFALFAGAALVIAAIATPVGIVVQRVVIGPAVAHLAVTYVTLSLGAGRAAILAVLAGVVVATALAAGWATRSAIADAIVGPLRED